MILNKNSLRKKFPSFSYVLNEEVYDVRNNLTNLLYWNLSNQLTEDINHMLYEDEKTN